MQYPGGDIVRRSATAGSAAAHAGGGSTTDRHPDYPRAVRRILGRKVLHRTDRYLSNLTEQSHRAVKQRYDPMLGFGNFESAARWDDDRRELRRCAAAADATA